MFIRLNFLNRGDMEQPFLARPEQLLQEHLINVSEMTSSNASKIGLSNIGRLLGLIHDLGKYSRSFQIHLAENNKDKVDHSTAGGQIIYDKLKDCPSNKLLLEIISLCCFSHHSGLIDMFDMSGKNNFRIRKEKDSAITNKDEILNNMEEIIKDKINLIDINQTLKESDEILKKIEEEKNAIPKNFYKGMLARFLLSCLIDADHTDSFNHTANEKSSSLQTQNYNELSWDIISERLEKHLKLLNERNKSSEKVKTVRKQISDDCLKAGQTYEKGCYKLEIPTGGGKTLASLRFAVEMAKKHNMDRIIYCIPYTTIIEQNADTVRKNIEVEKKDKGRIVLEHHSNLSQKNATDEEIDLNEILTQSWNSKIIFTTNVQFLEILFSKRTTNTRRLHQLSNSVIIFDEIQTLPIKCIHLFNNAVNFLVDICGSTVVLCTATQPLLDRANDDKFGNLKLAINKNIVNDVESIFQNLTRVEIIDNDLKEAKTTDYIGKKAIELAKENKNCLVVCNTTKSARETFQYIDCNAKEEFMTYHLSARMMPVHRKWILRCIKRGLKEGKKLIAVSTQVIEAGVDIDFNCGIRALAGLDSILQTAGRINRNGLSYESKKLYVYKFEDNSDSIEYIHKGADTTCAVKKQNPNIKISDLEMINKYYDDFYYKYKKDMKYLSKEIGDSLLNLLSTNKNNPGWESSKNILNQSFSTAGSIFRPIDDITIPVVVDKGKAHRIIRIFKNVYDMKLKRKMIKELSGYTVNIYPKQKENLYKAIHKISDDIDIYYIDKEYYDNKFGITEEYTLDKGGIC